MMIVVAIVAICAWLRRCSYALLRRHFAHCQKAQLVQHSCVHCTCVWVTGAHEKGLLIFYKRPFFFNGV